MAERQPAGSGTAHRARRARGAGSVALTAVAAVALTALFRFAIGGVPDPDSYYHFRHAALYADRGPGLSAFPWLTHSLVSRFASDIGYGFHLLLVPFTRISDPVSGVQWSSVFLAALALVCFSLALRRHGLDYAEAWPAMLFLLGPPLTYTFLMTRPQTLTMGFVALLLSFLVVGSPWGVLVAAFALSFTHLNIALVILPIAVVAYLARGLSERIWSTRPPLLALAGFVLGWLARPNPLGALRIEYVQTVVHGLLRREGVPLLFGKEWAPISLADAASYFPYFLACWVGLAVVVLGMRFTRKLELPAPLRSLLWSSLVLSVIFFALTVLNTKRGTPLWAAFAVMFVATAFTALAHPGGGKAKALGENVRLFTTLAVAFLLVLMMWEGVSSFLLQRKWQSGDPYRFRPAAEALARDSRPGDVVYNVDWGYFPELFFWNTKDRYVSGLDPIFLYAYDRGRYWKAHHLQAGDTSDLTCATPRCGESNSEDTYRVLTQDFGARYVVLEPSRWPALCAYLTNHPNVTPLVEDRGLLALRLDAARSKDAVR